MTQPGYTEIIAVLDRSGSMSTIKEDTEGGFNSFIKAQVDATQPGETCLVSLTQFDTQVEDVYSLIGAAAAPQLELKPRGGTALLDAVGQTIVKVGERLAAAPETARPEKVIFVIMTDGQENSSREWTRGQLFAAVTEQREKYGWEFVFLAANQDAISVGASMGMSKGASMTYGASAAGVDAAFAATSNYVTRTRAGVAATFSDEDRTKANVAP